MNILVTDPLSASGLAVLREAGHEVVERQRLTPGELASIVDDYDVLLVRSGTQATADLIGGMNRIALIGRAGAGVDNIDVAAATAKGIVVMNTPGGNTRSAAEHTIAMMFSMARSIPFAHASLTSGTWDRKRWKGFELQGKVLGVLGFGRIGRDVALMARGLGMRVLAYDPIVTAEAIRAESCTPASVDEILAASDVITVHVPLASGTRSLLGDAEFAKCRRGVRIINCARGGIVDEAALLRALDSGIVAGAALDVFAIEPPPPESPLLHHPAVVVTPHIGASTVEAQERVAVQIAEQVAAALRGEPLVGAVNSVPLRTASR